MKTQRSNKIIKLAIFMIGVFTLASCELHSSFKEAVQNGPNLVLFKVGSNVKNISHVSDGSSYDVPIKVYIGGPHMKDVSGNISFKLKPVSIPITGKALKDRNATLAKEGVNFSLPSKKYTLKAKDNYVGIIHFKMLTQGVTAPLQGPKVVKLKITDVSGKSVVGSGRVLRVALGYACSSHLAGLYAVVSNGTVVHHNVKVTRRGVGKYTSNIWGAVFKPANQPPNFFTRGVKFKEVCGTVSVPEQSLAQFGITVVGTGKTHVNGNPQVQRSPSDVGNFSFTLKYNIKGYGKNTSVYTYQGPLPNKSSNKIETNTKQKAQVHALPVQKIK